METNQIQVTVTRRAVLLRAFYGLLLYGFLRLKGLVTIPIVTRLLSPEEYGVINISWATVSMLWPLFSLGLHTGCGLFLVHLREKEQIRRAYYTTLNFMAISVAIGCVGMVLTSRWTGLQDSLGGYLLATVCYLVVTVLKETGSLILQVFQRTRTLMVLNTSVEIGSVLVSLVLLLQGFGGPGLIWSYTLVTLAGAIWNHLSHLKEFGYYRGIDWHLLRQYLTASLPLLPVSFTQWGLQSLDSYFLFHYHGSSVVGINSVAYSFAGLVMGVLVVLNSVYYPTLAYIVQQSQEQFHTLVRESVRAMTLLLGWVLVLFVLGSRTLIETLSAPAFYTAATILPIIVACYCSYIVMQMLQAATLAVFKRTGLVAGTYLAALLVNVVLNVIMIPDGGLMGAAIATFVSYALMLLGMLGVATFKARIQGVIPVFLRGLLPFALCLGPAVLLSPWHKGIAVTATGQLAATMVYVGVAWGVRSITRKDLRALSSALGEQ